MCNGKLTAEELARIKEIVRRDRAGLPTVDKTESKKRGGSQKIYCTSYYERHKEERRLYQREYERKKFGYKPRVVRPKLSEEEERQRRNEYAKQYYRKHKAKCLAYAEEYRKNNRDKFREYSRKQYLKRKGVVE